MLCLNRKQNERILIDGGITILVVNIGNNRVRLGIEAPAGTRIMREELAIVPKPPEVPPC